MQLNHYFKKNLSVNYIRKEGNLQINDCNVLLDKLEK